MIERKFFEIGYIGREFFIKGPVEASVKPRGFNSWCQLPYPDHPKGCPNFGKKESCPPLAPYFLDLYKPQVYVAFMQFAFDEYLANKRELHPDWTERALRNPWHFQSHLDSRLEKFINSQLQNPEFKNWQVIHNSEAMGVNIHLTAKRAGIELEWPPQKNMYRIALLTQTLNRE
jgi:hypothetical protein